MPTADLPPPGPDPPGATPFLTAFRAALPRVMVSAWLVSSAGAGTATCGSLTPPARCTRLPGRCRYPFPSWNRCPDSACRGRYSDLAHNASAEAVATAVHAVRIALTATGSRHRDLGVARFAEYSATPADWRSYLSGWLHPGRNNVTPASAAAGRDRLRLGLSLSGWPDLGYPSVSAARMPAPFVPGATPRSRLVPGTP